MTKIFAHRGASGMYPENTMLAFTKAHESGVLGIELDVHLTKDGHVVVIHDESVDRTTNGEGFIKDMTLPDIKKLRTSCGEEIPTLKEVMEWVKNIPELELNIELKTDIVTYKTIENKVLNFILVYNLVNRVIISSFNIQSIYNMRALNSEVRLAIISGKHLNSEVELFDALDLDSIHYFKDVVLNNETHIPLRKLRVWTVNDLQEIEQLRTLGVGCIMTDYP